MNIVRKIGCLITRNEELIKWFKKSLINSKQVEEDDYYGLVDLLVLSKMKQHSNNKVSTKTRLTKEQQDYLAKNLSYSFALNNRLMQVNYKLVRGTLTVRSFVPFGLIGLGLSRLYKDQEIEVMDRYITDDNKYINVPYHMYKGVAYSNDAIEMSKDLAERKEYDIALAIITPLINCFNDNALNNAGVMYERQGDYQSALMFYERSDTLIAKENIIKLMDYEHIPFNDKHYKELYEYLIKNNDSFGHVAKANYLYVHRNNCKGALKIINDALKVFENDELLLEEKRYYEKELGKTIN